MQAERDSQAHRRLQRKQNARHHQHVEAVSAADFRGGFEHVKQQRLRKQRVNRMFAILEHNHSVIRLVVTQASWDRWTYAVKMDKFKKIMDRWSAVRILAKRNRCWLWWKGIQQQYHNLQLLKIQKEIYARESQRRAYMNNFYNASTAANVSAVSQYRWPNQPALKKTLVRKSKGGVTGGFPGSLAGSYSHSLPDL